MANRATRMSAAYCGAAAVLVLSGLLDLLQHSQISDKLQEIISFFALPVLVFVPGFVFVLGARIFPAEAPDVLIDSSGVGSSWNVIVRMFCWMSGGIIAGTLYQLLQRVWL
jgi:hypothetical protein